MEQKQEQQKQQNNRQREKIVRNVGVTAAQNDIVQRFGSAVKEHAASYSGVDNEFGTTFKGLKELSQSKINPDDAARNTNQQAGYAAEIKTTALENAERRMRGDDTHRTTRTDDMRRQPDGKGRTIGGKNEPLYDKAIVDKNGFYLEGTGRQLKYVGNDAESCVGKLLSKKYNKYRDADVPIEIPADFFDKAKENLQQRGQKLQQQIEWAERNGNTALRDQKQAQLERVQKTEKMLRKGKLTKNEAIEARLHPLRSTLKDAAGVAHQAGKEGAKYGVLIGGSLSLIQNLVAVIRDEKEPEDALASVAVDTASSTAIGYGTGFVGSAVKGSLQNAKSASLRAVSKTNLPVALVSFSISSVAMLQRYYTGEITGVQCFEELGEQGVGMIATAMFAAIGQAVIPIPVVGGVIGGMVGYALASASYNYLLTALKEEQLAKQERERIESACAEHIAMIRRYRQETEQCISEYFAVYAPVFRDSLDGIKGALSIGDVDGVMRYSNNIVTALGKTPVAENMDEMDSRMLDEEPIRI